MKIPHGALAQTHSQMHVEITHSTTSPQHCAAHAQQILQLEGRPGTTLHKRSAMSNTLRSVQPTKVHALCKQLAHALAQGNSSLTGECWAHVSQVCPVAPQHFLSLNFPLLKYGTTHLKSYDSSSNDVPSTWQSFKRMEITVDYETIRWLVHFNHRGCRSWLLRQVCTQFSNMCYQTSLQSKSTRISSVTFFVFLLSWKQNK